MNNALFNKFESTLTGREGYQILQNDLDKIEIKHESMPLFYYDNKYKVFYNNEFNISKKDVLENNFPPKFKPHYKIILKDISTSLSKIGESKSNKLLKLSQVV
jgi:hypothetical protein